MCGTDRKILIHNVQKEKQNWIFGGQPENVYEEKSQNRLILECLSRKKCDG